MLCHKIYPAFFRGSSYLMELFYRSIIVTSILANTRVKFHSL